jgi:cellulose synthase/poly-beta-1,6-N-acetylglucosamine synthase-like glycosyltransferase
VTLLIPAFNEEAVIRRKLENSLALDYPRERLQVLVVDDASEDATASVVEEFAGRGVELVRKPERSGKMASLQLGVERARGDVVVMSDASPSYEPDAVLKLARSLHDPRVGIVVGTLAVWDSKNAVAKPAGLYWRYEAAIRRWESRLGSTVAMHGNLYAVRKSLFPKLDSRTVNDEWSIAMRVVQQGYRVVDEPAAVSYDDVSTEMGQEFRRRVRINAGRYQAFFGSQGLWPWRSPMVVFEIVSHKLLRLLLPFLMLGAFISNLLAVAGPDRSWVLVGLLVLQGAGYALAYAGRRLEGTGRSPRIANLAHYLVSSNLAALFGFFRFLANRQSVTWEKARTGSGP